MKSEFDGQIEQAKKLEEEIEGKIKAEESRLEKFGSKENYFSFLAQRAEARNQVEALKSKKRVSTLERMAQEVIPLLKELEEGLTTQSRRIEIVLNLAKLLKAADKIRTNFTVLIRDDLVRVELINPELRLVYGQTKEEVNTFLKRTKDDVLTQTDVRRILKDPAETVLIDLPFLTAKKFEEKKWGRIVQIDKPHFAEVIKEDPLPGILHDALFLNFGEPVRRDGRVSTEAQFFEKRNLSGPFEISPHQFYQFISDAETQKTLKRFQ